MGFRRLPPAIKVVTEQDAVKVLRTLERCMLVAFDTETTGLIRCRDRAVLLSLSEGINRWCVWPQAIKYFAELLQNPERRLIGHNVNFDQWMLLNVGIDIDRYTARNRARCIDTMVMHALIDDASPHDLKFLARLFLDIDMVPFKQIYGSQMRTRPLEDIFLDPINEAITVNYSALDAFATYELFTTLQRLLQGELITEPGSPYKNLWQYYMETETMFTKVLWHMEREGIDLNVKTLIDKAPVSEARLVELNHWFCQKLKRWDVNVNSGPQLEKLFFEDLNAVPMGYTETGKPQVSALFLKDRARKGCEYATNLLEYRHISKRLSTNIIGALETIGGDGRIHTSYNQVGAKTGRLACFAKGTLVDIHSELTGRPVKVAIEYVTAGQLAYSFDTDKELVLRKVLWSCKTGHGAVVRVHYLGSTKGWLDVTPDHKVMLATGKYRAAQELAPGDVLLSWNSTNDITRNTRVVHIEELPSTVDVYDMEVEDTHNLIANGVCSSNSRAINLQNVPPDMRDAFEAGDGNVLVSRDQEQLEMRVLAHVSGDPTLCDAINSGKDVHSATAATMYHVRYEDVAAAKAKDDAGEKLNAEEKKLKGHRKGAKTIQFGICVAEGQRVLTNRGLVPIEKILLADLVWDGVQFTHHDGVVYKGVKNVITYSGLTATANHKVWTNTGRKVCLRTAASKGLELARTGEEDRPIPVCFVNDTERNVQKRGKLPLCGRDVQQVLKAETVLLGQSVIGEKLRVQLPTGSKVRQRPAGKDVGAALRFNGTALRAGHTRWQPQLQGARDKGAVRVKGSLHSLGVSNVPRVNVQEAGLRQDRQQRALLTREPAASNSRGEYDKHVKVKARVYDIMNAGPLRRFTVENVVISNCYGMGPGKLSRDLGIEISEAKQTIATYFEAVPGVPAYFARKTEEASKQGFTTTVLGRRRQVHGISSLINSEQAQALRIIKNSPIQSAASEILKQAMNSIFADPYIYATGTKLLLQIHDELIFRVPQAFAQDHELFARIEYYMTKTLGIPMRVQLKVSGKSGKTWMDCK